MECIDEHGIGQEVYGSRVDYANLLRDNFILQPSVFWNRRMFQSVGFFLEKYAHSADYDYWLRCWEVSPGIYLPRILGRFRRWSGSHTSSNAKNQLRDTHSISLEHKKTSAQNAMQRIAADEIRWRLRVLRLRTQQTWWAFLKITIPIRHRLGLRRKRISSVLNRIRLFARQ
jgi:GT2 family glycosyltransferase